ncbi:DUF4178 domain-containing protein [Paucibacter sp. APW11]|uniref:DUF4178 domain-containing protein n=1 Tax=Roseateles aquae TaxID=3077235 RepID=A0ABU3PD20_9BURK|nr:DUF4178 domain-containing protein [Paucibacter sp. APW11]MDT9000423.1 DUF4178 domain-containing protein [Paucibacter sp. APW11]
MATAAPQRAWRALCPNCGAPLEFASAASASAVCSFCRSTLLREGEQLRRIGQAAELFDDYSPLQLGASGRYQGAAFRLIGRLQLGYDGGSWNEWHALFDSGRSGWLSEDNGSFVFSFEAPPEGLPAASALQLGAQQLLAGQPWRVAALTTITRASAQGELPQQPPAAGGYLIAELRNPQNEVATLDYGLPGRVLASIGRPVRLADLSMAGLREDSSKTLSARSFPCPSCGAALEPKLAQSKSIVCGQCKSVVDISATGGLGAELAHYAQENGLEPLLPLGRNGVLPLPASSGTAHLPWTVVGYQERCDLPAAGSDEEQTFWREYLLFNRQEGFAFLVDSEDGWSLVRPLTGAPAGVAGDTVNWQGKRFKRRWRYAAKVTYVLGEFYWRVQREDRALVTDYLGQGEARNELLSCEQSGQELVWSHGHKLDASEVAKAFRLAPEQRAALTRDAGATDLGAALTGASLTTKIVIALFVMAVLAIILFSKQDDGCQDYRRTYGEQSAEYAQCLNSRGSNGVRVNGGSGGSWGGFSSGGGGHK